jgi:hypothetical protein
MIIEAQCKSREKYIEIKCFVINKNHKLPFFIQPFI